MSENRLDYPASWQGTMFDEEFLFNYAKRPNIFGLFKVKGARRGIRTIRIPIIGALVASDFVPGAGDLVTFQTGTNSAVDVTLNVPKETTVVGDKFEVLQSEVEDMQAMIATMSEALLAAIDTSVLTMCAAYTALPAAQQFTTTAGSGVVHTTEAAVSNEIERLAMEAMVKLDALLGVSIGMRRIGLDSWLFHYLLKDSAKQSPERTDLPFGAVTGFANQIQGAEVFNFGTTSRTYDTYYSETVIKFYVFIPDAIAIGVQALPNMDAPFYDSTRKGTIYSADELYGLKEALTRGFIECSVRVAGNIFGL
jgi:hypothetical protein